MKLTVIIFSGMFIILFSLCFLAYNPSPSVPTGLYFKIPAWNIKKGDIVAFSDPFVSGLFLESTDFLILKRVAKAEEGRFWLKGDTEKSYDSRYFGYLSKDYIRFKVRPIWINKDKNKEKK